MGHNRTISRCIYTRNMETSTHRTHVIRTAPSSDEIRKTLVDIDPESTKMY